MTEWDILWVCLAVIAVVGGLTALSWLWERAERSKALRSLAERLLGEE